MSVQDHQPVRVLVADDNRDAAESLAILLRLWGYEVQVAYDGLAALKLAYRFHPQIALLDIQMPRLHGGEVARRLRASHVLDGILVIATSANSPDDDRFGRYDGLFDTYLVKPYNLDRLEQLLANCRAGACR